MLEAFLVGGARTPVGRYGDTVGCATQKHERGIRRRCWWASAYRSAGYGGTPTLTESEHDLYLIGMG
jgi:hypothetical protein